MSELADILKKQQVDFDPVVPFNAGKDKLLRLDFTEANGELTDAMLKDTGQFIQYINNKLQQAGALYGIGGYAEHRTIYGRSSLFDAETADEEPRRLHLGVDIWGKPHTAVMAPLPGIVHSYGFNDSPGDYGATIILVHKLGAVPFYSLYGHLSLNSIKNIQEGDRFDKGDIIAEFGLPFENGQWPPHLHFQLIGDMEGRKGDYPGVCKFSEKSKWLANSPDPDLILRMSGE